MISKNTLLCLGLFGYLALGAPVQAQLLIMPLGESTTYGYESLLDGTAIPGGYRSPLDTSLTALGYDPQFVGSSTQNSGTFTPSDHHNGYIGYTVQNISDNLDGDVEPGSVINDGNGHTNDNQGGYWLEDASHHLTVTPNIILLMIGGNDLATYPASPNLLTVNTYATALAQKEMTLIGKIQSIEPSSTAILVGGVLPFKDTYANGNDNLDNAYVKQFDDDLETLIDATFGTLQTAQVKYVDQYSSFVKANGSQNTALFSNDGIHPTADGYAIMAANWDEAIEQTVPEPSTCAMLVLGGIGLFIVRRHFSRS